MQLTFKQFLEASKDPENEYMDYDEYAGMKKHEMQKKHELDKAIKITQQNAAALHRIEQRSNTSRSGAHKKSIQDKKDKS